jgi:hypothetical protein
MAEVAVAGMRVKLTVFGAESAEQHSPGWRPRSGGNPGSEAEKIKPS